PVGTGEEEVQVGGDGRMERDRPAAGQDPAPRVVVGHGGDAGHAQPLDEPLVGGEEERAVPLYGTTEDGAELVAPEIGLGPGGRVEEVAGVERRVAVELEQRPAVVVRSGAGHGVDDATG